MVPCKFTMEGIRYMNIKRLHFIWYGLYVSALVPYVFFHNALIGMKGG